VDHDDRAGDDDAASDALIDEALAEGEGDEPVPPRPVDRFRRSALGSVAAAGLLGLRDALEGRPEKEEPAIVVDAPQPKRDGPVDVVLDFDHPERSRAVVRRSTTAATQHETPQDPEPSDPQ
jgi:hypothetical protein